MLRIPVLAAVLVCAACDAELSPEEKQAQAERDIAMVEAANNALPPLRPVTPDPILYPDMEQHDLYGQACNYAPGTSLGTRVIAREGDAFVKIDGDVIRLAADPGSRELPAQSRSLYDGREYSLRLAIEGEGEPAAANSGVSEYQGTVSLRDRWGRVVYDGVGLAQCGA
jgi:hypothetical protein